MPSRVRPSHGQVCEGCPEASNGCQAASAPLIQAAKRCGLTDDGCLHAAQGHRYALGLAAVSAHKTQV